jgi:hypothetical protein
MLYGKKKLIVRACFTSILLVPTFSFAQSGQAPAQESSQPDVKQRLLIEAGRIEPPKYIDNASASPEAAKLAGRLSDLARDLQIAWLKRGLDDLTPPSDLAERLSDEGVARRKKIVADVGRIATQTLTGAIPQTGREVGKGKPPTSRAPGAHNKSGTGRAAEPIGPEQLEEFAGVHCSMKFNFIEQHSTETPCLLTLEQISLSNRLDEIVRVCLIHWGKEHLTAAEIAKGWPNHARRLADSLTDIADSILFQTILDSEQVEKFKRAYWKSRGLASLIDPELGSRLGISRDQREMIKAALGERTRNAIESKESTLITMDNRSLAEREQTGAELNAIRYQQQAASDESILELLTATQVSKINQLLGEKALRPKAPQRNQSSKRPAPSS